MVHKMVNLQRVTERGRDMLSRYDIENELGKGICVFPLKLENIKENSINLSAGKYAWATRSCDIYFREDVKEKSRMFSLNKDSAHSRKITIGKGDSAIVEDKNGQKYIVLLPMSTTLIETEEVLAVNKYIGGTYHSKVGLVSMGLGHIGTMVGPSFSGESLLAFHNISEQLIILKPGDSFVSVVFYYLKTAYAELNPTTSGHTDKFAKLGLKVTDEQLDELNEDWKKRFSDVCQKMCESEAYKKIQDDLKARKKKEWKKFFCKKNIWIIVITLFSLAGLYIGASFADSHLATPVWVDRFWNVGFSGIFIAVFTAVIAVLKGNAKRC